MGFDLYVFTRIAYFFMQVIDIGNFALCCKQFHKAARLGCTKFLRWNLIDSQVTNAILFDERVRFFVHLIRKVRINQFLTLSCLSLIKLNIRNVVVEIEQDLVVNGDDIANFDLLTGFGIKFRKSACSVQFARLPKHLQLFTIQKDTVHNTHTPNLNLLQIPTSLKTFYTKNGFERDMLLPDTLQKIIIKQADSFSFADVLDRFPNLVSIQLIDEERKNIVPVISGVYPKLRHIRFERKYSLANATSILVASIVIKGSDFPNLKSVSATHLKFVNNLRKTVISSVMVDLDNIIKIE